MRLIFIGIFLILSSFLAPAMGEGAERESAENWLSQRLADLPRPALGPFVGSSSGRLIVAGGQDGREGELLTAIYILESEDREQGGVAAWQIFEMDAPLAWGAAISAENSLICIGGLEPGGYSRRVVQLIWEDGGLQQRRLPDLPESRAFGAGAALDGALYVWGGQRAPGASAADNSLIALNLRDPSPVWEELERCPGPGRIGAAMTAQGGALLLFGGRELLRREDGAPQYRSPTDAWSYRPTPFDGTRQKGWFQIADAPRVLSAAIPFPTGQSHIIVLADRENPAGETFHASRDSQPGREIFAYHTITDTWVSLGRGPDGAGAPRSAPWQGGVVLVGGVDADGKPAGEVRTGSISGQTEALHWLDYLTIGVYLVGLIGIGVYFSKKEKGSEDFFLGGRRIPWWAAGISLYATGTSAISFMAIPTKTYVTNQVYGLGSLWSPVFWIPAAFVIVPLIRRLRLTSTYEYLEQRFSPGVRLLGGAICIAFQVMGRMSVLLLLPAMALSAVTGIDVFTAVAIMGLMATIYTVMGGIHAVIWTDVVQFIVLFGGGILAFAIMVFGLDGGIDTFIGSNLEYGKFHSFEWGLDLTVPVFWIFALSSLMQLAAFPNDQVMVQRVLATPSPKEARNAAILLAAIVVPGTILFHLLGSGLFAHFRANPESLSPTMENIHVLPLFIVQSLPIGLTGLVIAGLFAASMSSLDSSMNSVSTVIVTDFYGRFKPEVADNTRLVLARWITGVVGVLGTGMALFMASFEIKSLYDMWMQLAALLGGGFAGVYALGMLTRRTHALGALIGATASVVITVLIKAYTPVHFMLYGVASILSCMLVGYLASIVLPGKKVDLQGLTVYTQIRSEEN
jgi:solute:Na+ symporter, SSS family